MLQLPKTKAKPIDYEEKDTSVKNIIKVLKYLTNRLYEDDDFVVTDSYVSINLKYESKRSFLCTIEKILKRFPKALVKGTNITIFST